MIRLHKFHKKVMRLTLGLLLGGLGLSLTDSLEARSHCRMVVLRLAKELERTYGEETAPVFRKLLHGETITPDIYAFLHALA